MWKCFRVLGPIQQTQRSDVYISTNPSSALGPELLAMSDSDSLIQALYQTQSLNHLAMATGAAVMYDQVLNFSQEVDHIWNRRWGPTTALYLVARYSGPVSLFTSIASIVRLNWSLTVIKIIYIIGNWSSNVFLTAMQAILLMRVFALCGRSKTVLIFLSACFFCQTSCSVVGRPCYWERRTGTRHGLFCIRALASGSNVCPTGVRRGIVWIRAGRVLKTRTRS
ncbi:hypothetical protein BV22DRAFT_386216 [Leucogyrophana mollusca]|uniref:Uncharacterized protein n=1 Tax=Leucogyrophana mollusca TaxID=85980 RepID=A0ACB8BMN6_9AGAM|nr:hypothetical protein BV22DRAFT_386216 [Leucogyrophana mollusca]